MLNEIRVNEDLFNLLCQFDNIKINHLVTHLDTLPVCPLSLEYTKAAFFALILYMLKYEDLPRELEFFPRVLSRAKIKVLGVFPPRGKHYSSSRKTRPLPNFNRYT